MLPSSRPQPWTWLTIAVVCGMGLFVTSCGPAPNPPPSPPAAAGQGQSPAAASSAAPPPASAPQRETPPATPAEKPPSSPPSSPRQGQSPAKPRVQATPGADFTLKIGQTAEVTGGSLIVAFERVTDDSRCPKNTNCVWEGDAVVHLGLQGANAEKGTLELHSQIDTKQEGTFQNYRVRIVQLAPWPQTSGKIPDSQYIATLKILK